MLDLRRFRGPLAGLAIVAGLMLVGSLAISAALGPKLHRLRKAGTFMDAHLYNEVGERVAAAARDASPPPPGGGDPLGILLGSSVLHWNIDARVLSEEMGGKVRWLSLHGNDMNAGDFEDAFDMAVRGGLRPAFVVVAYSPLAVSRFTDLTSDEALATFQQALRALLAGRLAEARGLVRHPGPMARGLLKTLFPSRTRFNNTLRRNLYEARSRMFGSLGVEPGDLYVPTPDPWHVSHPFDGVPRASERVQQASLADCRNRGWLDPGSYAGGGAFGATLMDLVRRARSIGARVVLIQVPQSSLLRSVMPPEANRALGDLLAAYFPDDGPTVLDYTTRMPDDLFYEPLHLNYRGRDIFSHIVGQDLRDVLVRQDRDQ